MAAFENTRTDNGIAIVAYRATAVVADLALQLRGWNDARITRKALAALSDRELADIGLSRGEIEVVSQSNLIR